MFDQVDLVKLRGTGRTTLMHKKIIELIRDRLSEKIKPIDRVVIQYVTYAVKHRQVFELKERLKESLSDLGIEIEVKEVVVQKQEVHKQLYEASFTDESRLLQNLVPVRRFPNSLTINVADHEFMETTYLNLLSSLVKIERSIVEGVVSHEWSN